MSYTTYDFTESLQRVGIVAADIDRVVCAWGKGDGQGDDAGHYRWAEDGVSDWSGGFLMHMKAGGFIYLTGWCDYTGWGCQDGAEVHRFETMPTFDELRNVSEYQKGPATEEWDIDPIDLNRSLAPPSAEPKE